MTVEDHFKRLAVAFGDANPRWRQESEPPGDVQPKYSFPRPRDGESYEFARQCRSFPLIAFDIEPRDQPAAIENSAIPHFELRKNDQGVSEQYRHQSQQSDIRVEAKPMSSAVFVPLRTMSSTILGKFATNTNSVTARLSVVFMDSTSEPAQRCRNIQAPSKAPKYAIPMRAPVRTAVLVTCSSDQPGKKCVAQLSNATSTKAQATKMNTPLP